MVARFRSLGALLVGKTTTTEFACFQPTPTTNPHNAQHTPGGSSSGSAAAVAKRAIHIGLGSQTAASITRPAAYCGVVGYKSSLGRFPLGGVKGLAPSFDSFGWLSRDVRDACVVFGALSGEPVAETAGRFRVAVCRTPMWGEAGEGARAALETATRSLQRAGHDVAELTLPGPFDEAAAAQATIMAAEASSSLHKELAESPEKLSDSMRAMLESGRDTERATLDAARAVAEQCMNQMPAIWDRFDMIVAPSAPGSAPLGLESTGSPVFSRLWTVIGVPSVTIPVEKDDKRLPIGVQILAPRDQDARLLGMALSVEKALFQQV
jgi:amidase